MCLEIYPVQKKYKTDEKNLTSLRLAGVVVLLGVSTKEMERILHGLKTYIMKVGLRVNRQKINM